MSAKTKVVGVVLMHQCGDECRPKQSSGPSKVNSDTYVSEWQRIFGGEAKQASA